MEKEWIDAVKNPPLEGQEVLFIGATKGAWFCFNGAVLSGKYVGPSCGLAGFYVNDGFFVGSHWMPREHLPPAPNTDFNLTQPADSQVKS